MSTKYAVLLTIDIGEKNLALVKDRINLEKIEGLTVPEKKFDKNGECLPDYYEYIKQVAKCGKRQWDDKADLTSKTDKKWGRKRVINQSFLLGLTLYLKRKDREGVFDNVDAVLIENQLKKADNNRQIQFHIRSWFITLFLDWRPVVSFSATHKTKVLGAPKKVFDNKKNKLVKFDKPRRKKWSSEQARNILTLRNDQKTLERWFGGRSQTHDLSDCLLMSLAFTILYWGENNEDILEL